MEELFDSWKNQNKVFLISNDLHITYSQFYLDIQKTRESLRSHYEHPQLFVLEAASNYETYVKFLSLILEKNIVFMSPSFQFNDVGYRKLLENETASIFHYVPRWQTIYHPVQQTSATTNALMLSHLEKKRPGFIVRTSGTSGKKFKFILHNPESFINKYQMIGNHFQKTMAFSPADSIAGLETLLEVVTHSNTLITDSDHLTPMLVGKLIEKNGIDYYQTTPSFLTLMIITGVFLKVDMKGLKKIAYGSEPVLGPTLFEIKRLIPHIEFKHTYGMSEFGILATITNQDDPTTFILDKKINEGRVTSGILEIKTSPLSLGYLNYENTSSPWFKTGDVVHFEDNRFMKIIGREDDLINLAGRKFYPSEVEDLLIHIEGVSDVAISSEKNEIIGNIIIASFFLKPHFDEGDFRKAFKIYCELHVPHFMVPHKVNILQEAPITSRFKKSRST